MSRWLAEARREDGMALATVMAMSTVLFLLATTLVMLSTQQQVNAVDQVQRTKALHAADAGINAYSYMLSRNPSVAKTQPTTSGVTADASWTVTAVPPGLGSAVTQLTSTGRIAAANGGPAVTRVVKASVNPGSFADYMFLFNTDLVLAVNGLIRGRVWSNGNITNNGEITDYAYASGSIGGSGIFDKTPTPNAGNLKSIATSDGTYWGDSGSFTTSPTAAIQNNYTHHYLGYKVTVAGNGGTIQRIQSVSTTSGAIVVDPAPSTQTSFTTPPNGVLYFDDPIWLSGTYAAKLTVVCGDDIEDPGTDSTYGRNAPGMSGMNPTSTATPKPNNVNSSIYLWNNLVSSDPSNADQVCGIVSPGDISLPSEYPTTVMPDNLTIQAAMLSTNGSIHSDFTTGRTHAYLKMLGARAQWDQGGIQLTSGSTVTAGFVTRDYFYDTNLDITTPPNFPPLGDGTLKVQQWVEN